MSKIKSLADQLRDQIAAPAHFSNAPQPKPAKPPRDKVSKPPDQLRGSLLQQIRDYNSSANRAMVHVKLDDGTAKLVNHFKMATGIDNIRLVAFAVRHLFENNPELKDIIKAYTQNLEL